MSKWRPIKTAHKARVTGIMPKADLWLVIRPSAKSMGWGDSFRVPDCWKHIITGKWVHDYMGKEQELDESLITHWMPIPKAPSP